MTDSSRPRALSRLFAAILSIPLRFKITIPYLIVAILLAGLATWLVSQSFARALQERFRGQLVDSSVAASDALFKIELDQLTGVRAIARTSGVTEALTAHSWDGLDRIVRPLVVNSRLSLVHVLDSAGRPVYGIRATPEGFAENENADFASWAPVRHVLAGERDDLGDKYVGLVDAPWGLTLYTVGPVKDGNKLVGAVMVGTPLTDIADAMSSASTANITIFRPNGQIALTTFEGEGSLSALDAETIAAVVKAGTNRLEGRLLAMGPREFNEGLGALVLRGEPGGWTLSVALPRSAVTDELSPTEIAGWFTLGILAVIGLGVIVAQIVAVPVFELVQASSQVAAGDLTVEVKERAKDELGLLAQRFNWMVRELRQRELMRELFGHVVSEEVREALLAGKVGLGGELKVVTVLFTDIRDFTLFSESNNPQEIVSLLNSYFEVISDAIREAGGLINKFGGDSTLAIFGAPISAPPFETARRALEAAFNIRTRLAEFNARRIEKDQQPIRIGIGINTGEVVTGNIGSRDRFEYTVIGDTVNTAARVQSLTTRFTDSNILITDETRKALGQDAPLLVVDHGDVALKGKSRLVRVYGVIGMRLTPAKAAAHWGQVPRRDVLEALYLYCRGFHPRTIALTKNIDQITVHQWIEGAARHFDQAGEELHEEFGLNDTELNRLKIAARRPAETGSGSGHVLTTGSLALSADRTGKK